MHNQGMNDLEESNMVAVTRVNYSFDFIVRYGLLQNLQVSQHLCHSVEVISVRLRPLLPSPMYWMFYTQQVFPRHCNFAIENLLEMANITEALEGAGETEDILAKIAKIASFCWGAPTRTRVTCMTTRSGRAR